MFLNKINRWIRPLGYSVVKNDYFPLVSDIFSDQETGFKNSYKKVEGFSLTSYERMYALYKSAQYLSDAKIEGDFVECGVWKGGSAMMMALALLERSESDRNLYLYDTYTGMPESGEFDQDFAGRDANQVFGHTTNDKMDNLSIGLEQVKKNMQRTAYPDSRIHYIQGKVEETIPQSIPEKIALLRLDTDYYESTYHELVHLWPRLSSGGVLIIDDYGHWRGARKATDQYLKEQGLELLMQRIDYTARLVVKK